MPGRLRSRHHAAPGDGIGRDVMQSVVNGALAGAQWPQTFRGSERAFAMGAD